MIAILAMHGVVSKRNNDLVCHRSLSDLGAFEHYLKRRKSRFVPLEVALREGGCALTIDDATNASASAATIARRYGHSATLFVNPYYIEGQKEHFFCMLSSALDNRSKTRVSYNSNEFDLSQPDQVKAFRSVAKIALRSVKTEAQRLEIVFDVASALGVREINLPHYLQTVKQSRLEELVEIGVDIQNHGWTHVEIDCLSADEQQNHIREGQEWLRRMRANSICDFYAVPFGNSMPKDSVLSQLGVQCLLADDGRPPGTIKSSVINRLNVVFD